MKAMILAAGRGERMRPLTETCPKPLLQAGGCSLIEHQLRRLKSAGIEQIIINIAYLGEQIRTALGDGSQLGVKIVYSPEPEPLETGGAINLALPLLGDQPFVLVNGDVWCDFDLARLKRHQLGRQLGHLLMVPNPGFKARGDFRLDEDSLLQPLQGASEDSYTYSGIALLSPALVADYPERRSIFPLAEAFRWAVAADKLSAELYRGDWRDIGTVARLEQLRADLA
ncbi:MAG: nucleotidyltransferase family protein [Cellvibrionaceae bacterium]|nr:nucleotidyltransferase family protein [Cellvibrionaceae bacterium]